MAQIENGENLASVREKINQIDSAVSGRDAFYVADTIAAMADRQGISDGASIRVNAGFRSEPEFFSYDLSSSLTADGALVVDATGMGLGRWISTRRSYASVAELQSDIRPLNTGEQITVFGGGEYTVASSGATDHHITTAGGEKLYVTSAGTAGVKAYGAVLDGVTDDTAAVQSAWDDGVMHFPAGTCLITDTISGTDQMQGVSGEGQASVILFSPASARPLFSLTRTEGETAFLSTRDIRITADVAGAGFAIHIEETRSGAGPHVVGGVDFLHVGPNTIFEGTGSGYWYGPIHAENAGGVYWSNASARNDNDAVAQADSNCKGVFIDNSDSDFNVIRALKMSNFYLQRFYTPITCNAVNSIETVYIDNGEIVGALRGMVFEGGGKVGAITVGSVHFDIQAQAIFGAADTSVNIVRLVGADFRKGTNGGSATAGNLIDLSKGEMLNVTGCQFNGDSANKATYAQNGIRLAGDYFRLSIDGSNLFRDLNTPIILDGTVNTGNVGGYTADACDNLEPSITTTNADTIGVTSRWAGMSALFYKSSDQTIATGTRTKVTWDSADSDDLGMLVTSGADAVTVPSGVTAIRVKGSAWMNNAASGLLTLQIRKNGADVRGGGYRVIDLSVATEDALQVDSGALVVSAGDLIDLSVTQTSGANLDVYGTGVRGFHTWLSVEVVR